MDEVRVYKAYLNSDRQPRVYMDSLDVHVNIKPYFYLGGSPGNRGLPSNFPMDYLFGICCISSPLVGMGSGGGGGLANNVIQSSTICQHEICKLRITITKSMP